MGYGGKTKLSYVLVTLTQNQKTSELRIFTLLNHVIFLFMPKYCFLVVDVPGLLQKNPISS
jgi:hypothetical protein